jgi:hypothetical protein
MPWFNYAGFRVNKNTVPLAWAMLKLKLFLYYFRKDLLMIISSLDFMSQVL